MTDPEDPKPFIASVRNLMAAVAAEAASRGYDTEQAQDDTRPMAPPQKGRADIPGKLTVATRDDPPQVLSLDFSSSIGLPMGSVWRGVHVSAPRHPKGLDLGFNGQMVRWVERIWQPVDAAYLLGLLSKPSRTPRKKRAAKD